MSKHSGLPKDDKIKVRDKSAWVPFMQCKKDSIETDDGRVFQATSPNGNINYKINKAD